MSPKRAISRSKSSRVLATPIEVPRPSFAWVCTPAFPPTTSRPLGSGIVSSETRDSDQPRQSAKAMLTRHRCWYTLFGVNATRRVPLRARNTLSLPLHRFLSRSIHTPITSSALPSHPSHTPFLSTALPPCTRNTIQIPLRPDAASFKRLYRKRAVRPLARFRPSLTARFR
jgi:hypothetical protein